MAHHATNANYYPWRCTTGWGPAPTADAEWDRLLGRLGLTDAEALAAVREGREVGQTIKSFVRRAFHEHFIPEDVLRAMNLQREAGRSQLFRHNYARARRAAQA